MPKKGELLDERDWNFTAVSDSEVVACCLWEYSRESPTIKLAAAVHQLNTRHVRPEGEPEPTQDQKAFYEQIDLQTQMDVSRAGFDYNEFLERFWNSAVAGLRFYDLIINQSTSHARAFQAYPTKLRRRLGIEASKSWFVEPLGGATVADLERLWNLYGAEVRQIRENGPSAHDDSEDAALGTQTDSILGLAPDGKSPSSRTRTVAFTLDFSRFSDNEIEEAFQSWLKLNRPSKWRRPIGYSPTKLRRGKKLNDYRVALERLGLMRLLHWYSPEMLRRDLPKAWSLYGRKESDFRREVSAAERFFADRFPFLPEDERPISHQRYMTWWRPLEKELDAMLKSLATDST